MSKQDTWWCFETRARSKFLGRWQEWNDWEKYRHSWTADSGPELFNERGQAVHHARIYCHRNTSLDDSASSHRMPRYSYQVVYRVCKVQLADEASRQQQQETQND